MKYSLKKTMDKPFSEIVFGSETFHLLDYDEIRKYY